MPVIRIVDAAAVRPLRRTVLRAGGDAASVLWAGDAAAVHLALLPRGGGEVIGCVSVLRGTGQLRGMAMAPAWAGRGYGRLLLRAAEQVGATWCNARLSAEGFYARHGWLPVGDVFVQPETGLPHRRMRRGGRRRRLH